MAAMGKKVVMQDIADRLNISRNSVSQALSGKDGVSEETRRKIIKTAEEMGYRYTKKKTSADKKAVKTIGLIASEFAFSMTNFFGEIYLAFEREAQRHGMNLLIQSITPAARDRQELPSFIDDGQVGGIVVPSHISTEDINKSGNSVTCSNMANTAVLRENASRAMPYTASDATAHQNAFTSFRNVTESNTDRTSA